jgi:hypothetical protein
MAVAPDAFAGLAERGTLGLIRKLGIFQNSAYIETVNRMTGII